MALDKELVMKALRTVQEPELMKDIVTLNIVKDVRIEGDQVQLTLELTNANGPIKEKIKADALRALGDAGAQQAQIVLPTPAVTPPNHTPNPWEKSCRRSKM